MRVHGRLRTARRQLGEHERDPEQDQHRGTGGTPPARPCRRPRASGAGSGCPACAGAVTCWPPTEEPGSSRSVPPRQTTSPSTREDEPSVTSPPMDVTLPFTLPSTRTEPPMLTTSPSTTWFAGTVDVAAEADDLAGRLARACSEDGSGARGRRPGTTTPAPGRFTITPLESMRMSSPGWPCRPGVCTSTIGHGLVRPGFDAGTGSRRAAGGSSSSAAPGPRGRREPGRWRRSPPVRVRAQPSHRGQAFHDHFPPLVTVRFPETVLTWMVGPPEPILAFETVRSCRSRRSWAALQSMVPLVVTGGQPGAQAGREFGLHVAAGAGEVRATAAGHAQARVDLAARGLEPHVGRRRRARRSRRSCCCARMPAGASSTVTSPLSEPSVERIARALDLDVAAHGRAIEHAQPPSAVTSPLIVRTRAPATPARASRRRSRTATRRGARAPQGHVAARHGDVQRHRRARRPARRRCGGHARPRSPEGTWSSSTTSMDGRWSRLRPRSENRSKKEKPVSIRCG